MHRFCYHPVLAISVIEIELNGINLEMKFDLKGLKPPYFVHSALSKVKFTELSGEQVSRIEFIESHLHSIENNLGRKNIIFPTFNFNFKETGEFRPQSDDTTVGSLPNYLIGKKGFYRSHTPFFSCISPNYDLVRNYVGCSNYQPFSENSIFGDLYKSDGSIIFFGANVTTLTFIHFVEHFTGPPIYRYDKYFHGQVVTDSNSKVVEVKFHVRPLGINLAYDRPKIEKVLRQAGALLELAPNVYGVRARAYTEAFGDLLNQEDFPLLDEPTREKVIAKYKQLGRRFIISDFEN